MYFSRILDTITQFYFAQIFSQQEPSMRVIPLPSWGQLLLPSGGTVSFRTDTYLNVTVISGAVAWSSMFLSH